MILPLKKCGIDLGCHFVEAVRDTIVESWRDAISDALGKALKTLGSFWIEVKTPAVDTDGSIASWMNAYLEPVAAVTAVGCLIGAGIQLALARDGATQLQNLVMGIAKMIGVSFLFIPFAGLAHIFSDEISNWIINESMKGDNKNFGKNIITVGVASLSPGIVVFAGLIGLVVTIMQIGLMYARGAMLILICSVVPVVGSTMTTKTGLNWWKKLFGWWVAFVLYKPFASIIYAIAFKLFEDKDILGEHSIDDLGRFLMGIMLLIFATLALPALISFLSPVIEGAAPLSGGGAMGMLKMPEGSSQPTGARNVNSSSNSSSGSGSGGGQNSSSSSGGSGSGSGGGDGSGSGSGSGSGGTPSGSKSTPAPGGSSTGAGSSAGGGSAAGGGAAGGASGAAAAHPAVAVAVGVAKGAAAVVQGVNRAANETTNQGN